MAHKLVKYRLTELGEIPTYIKNGGKYFVNDDSQPSPQDCIMIGISKDNVDISEAISEITSKINLQSYLSDCAKNYNWIDMDFESNSSLPFDAETHATILWNQLTTFNGE